MTPRAVIAGIGQSAFGRALPQSGWELALDAINAALADADVAPEEIDGMVRYSPPFEHVSIPQAVRSIGVRELSFFSEAPLGGEALGAVLGQAAMAIETGRAHVALVYRSLSQSTTGRFGRADTGADEDTTDIVAPEQDNLSFSQPHGFLSPGHQFAMQATRYMHDAEITVDELTDALASIAITQRAYAHENPNAIMRGRALTRDVYDNARMISWPLRLFDYCLENDGAIALVVTTAERARSGRPVSILSTCQSLTPYQEPLGLYSEDLGRPFPPAAADRLYDRAGIGPERIRVAELYDACSLMPVRSLETYHLVPDGQGWRRAVEEGTGPSSPLPVNTHGGHLSEAYIHGLGAVTEAVRQIRGDAATPISGADIALVGAPCGSAAILAA